jgi:hypothetical protein
LLRVQKAGLMLLPTTLRLDIEPLTDKILEKALASNPSERYPKARDFGDAFFNALTTVTPWETTEEPEIEQVEEAEDQREFFVVQPINKPENSAKESPIEADIHIASESETEDAETSEIKTNEPPSWEKRSPEPPKKGSFLVGGLAIAGVVFLLLAFWGISRLVLNRSNQSGNLQNQSNQNDNPVVPLTEKAPEDLLPTIEGDLPPRPRLQTTPPDTQRFQNTKENLKGDLAKNFLGFEIFYPLDWKKTETPTNFLDISRRDSSGLPIEQMIVTRYESRGTMTLDRPNFPKLVEKSNQDLKKSLGESFKVVSEGETTIQNGRWKVYEVKFQSTGENEKGGKVTLWGRRLWLPVQRAGVQNGFVITLLATSLSDSVNSADDVGVQGELANILETFEPEQF